ncbi:hypothetical protein JOC70_000791 [Clostridium pascui]|nr:hypothetical protein [Clostridium pascui]MBM7869322.1 hypothetical protein [Clostridium pascui]
MKEVLMWSGIIAIGVITVMITSYVKSMTFESMELERPDLIEVEEC